MAKLKIAGNALVVTSTIKAESMYLIDNKAVLKDEEGNQAYVLQYDPTVPVASIGPLGSLFNKTNRAGCLEATILVANNDIDAVKKAYADAIIQLNAAEDVIGQIIADRSELIERTFADVEVVE